MQKPLPIQICAMCDGLIEIPVSHDCVRGLTDNLNRLHHNQNEMHIQILDLFDGLLMLIKKEET